jgi:hypothetical protein
VLYILGGSQHHKRIDYKVIVIVKLFSVHGSAPHTGDLQLQLSDEVVVVPARHMLEAVHVYHRCDDACKPMVQGIKQRVNGYVSQGNRQVWHCDEEFNNNYCLSVTRHHTLITDLFPLQHYSATERTVPGIHPPSTGNTIMSIDFGEDDDDDEQDESYDPSAAREDDDDADDDEDDDSEDDDEDSEGEGNEGALRGYSRAMPKRKRPSKQDAAKRPRTGLLFVTLILVVCFVHLPECISR